MPTRTQVLNARPQTLLDMVHGWSPFMAAEEQTAHTYRGYVERPGGQPWEGDTADAATTAARNHHGAVADAHDTVAAGVRDIANMISADLIPPLTNAQQIIANAEGQPGVTVNEDLSITYTPPAGTSEAAADRNRQIVADAAKELQDSANTWWAAEQQVASQITTLRGHLDATIPDTAAKTPGPPLTMVGPFALPPEVAAAAVKPPGQTTPGDTAAPGQVGPFPVPAAVAAAAGNVPVTAPVTKQDGVEGTLGDLLGANDSATGVPANGQPGGLPAALSQLPLPPDPAAVSRQAAKVDAARQNLNAAQANLDDAAGQTYTHGAGTGPGRDVTNPLSQAVFGARAELTDQTRTLNELNYAAAASGAAPVAVPALPPHADVQAFPAEPSQFAAGSRALSEGSLGIIPDVAKDIDTFTNWDQHSGADKTQAVLDATGMVPIPGAKFLGEALNHGLDALTGVTHHLDDIPTPHPHADTPDGGHTPVDAPVEHHDTGDFPGVGDADTSSPIQHSVTPDTFTPNQGLHYTSGDPHYPGGWPPGTPEATWHAGDADPGWHHVNRGPDKQWMDYQEQISGAQRLPDGRIPEYAQLNPETGRPVNFDGHTYRDGHEVFLDAKDGYAGLVTDPGKPWTDSQKYGLIDEVDRQLQSLPPGAGLEIHVSDPVGAAAVRKLIEANDFFGATVIYTPKAP